MMMASGHTIYRSSLFNGDFEDPVERGILRKSSCRHYRAKLHAERVSNVIHGSIIMVSVAVVICAALAYRFVYYDDAKIETGLNENTRESTIPFLQIDLWKYFTNWKVGTDNKGGTQSCNQPLNTTMILEQLCSEVINQDYALKKLEYTLQLPGKLKSVIFTGPSGVGKSLTAEVLSKVFPWPENVQIYLWDTLVPKEANKISILRKYIKKISKCGQNLIIIDNLKSFDHNIVLLFNSLVEEYIDRPANVALQNVVIVYVFNLDMSNYWEQFELLQQSPADSTVINFRSFGEEDLADCLCHILKLENRVLDKTVFESIMRCIDVCMSGCRNVRQEVLSRGNVRLLDGKQ